MKYFYTLILLLSLILLQSCTTKKVDHSSEEAVEDLKSTDIYTLRRIVPKDRGMDWGDLQP